jgi:hypothetical protein
VAREILIDGFVIDSPTDDKFMEQPVGSPEVDENRLDAIRRGPRIVQKKHVSTAERC